MPKQRSKGAEKSARWRRHNPERKKEIDARWYRHNPEKGKARSARKTSKLPSNLSGQKKGAIAELEAACQLAKAGYEVFRNLSSDGMVDIVAINFDTEEKLLIDVKSHTCMKLTDRQRTAGVVLLVPDGVGGYAVRQPKQRRRTSKQNAEDAI